MPSASLPEDQTEPQPPAPRRERRTQADRTRATREKLMQAAIDVLLEQGYGRLTTKEVARVAGVSNGALMHHFASKAELVVAATAMVYEEAIVRGQRVAQTANAELNLIEGYLSDCLSIYFDWPFVAALETIVVARTDPELMEQILPVMERYRSTCDDIWLKVFKRAGLPAARAKVLLNLTLNLTRGMAINRLWRHDDRNYQSYLKEWVAITAREIAASIKPADPA
ncbi:MAG: TetR/AcrR family transcriptional regulator [Ottowia sp.]|uniref:TetR/AcrR family transcriptional regulator n=1 Tax=Ottowia sp. TaxID=1898956 RepID=UPI003C752CCA